MIKFKEGDSARIHKTGTALDGTEISIREAITWFDDNLVYACRIVGEMRDYTIWLFEYELKSIIRLGDRVRVLDGSKAPYFGKVVNSTPIPGRFQVRLEYPNFVRPIVIIDERLLEKVEDE